MSLDFTLFHPIPQGKRERPVGTKGKGKGTGYRIGAWISLGIQTVRARTHDTKRFPGWTHTPTSDLHATVHVRVQGGQHSCARENTLYVHLQVYTCVCGRGHMQCVNGIFVFTVSVSHICVRICTHAHLGAHSHLARVATIQKFVLEATLCATTTKDVFSVHVFPHSAASGPLYATVTPQGI